MTRRTERRAGSVSAIAGGAWPSACAAAAGVRLRRRRSAAHRPHHLAARPHRHARRRPHRRPRRAAPATPPIQGVKFFVNGAAVGQDADGPVYAVDWVDDNPFAPTVISVEVTDAKGRTAHQHASSSSRSTSSSRPRCISVLVEATVHDKAGRSIGGIGTGRLRPRARTARARSSTWCGRRSLPATYVLLVDSSQSIAHGVDFLRDAVTRFMRYLRPDDRVLVVPFSRTLGAGHRADRRRRRPCSTRCSPSQPGGGTAIYDALVDDVRDDPPARGPARAGAAHRRLRRAQRVDARRRGRGRADVRRDRLRHRRRRRRRHLAQGRGAAQELRRGHRRPRLLPVPRERAAGRARPRRRPTSRPAIC